MYAIQQDIIDRYSVDLLWIIAETLSDPADPESELVIDDVAIDRALTDASSEIDSYLNARYEMPLPTTPDILTIYCVDVGIYNLATGTKMSDDIKDRYNRAIKGLIRIAKGDADLGLPKAQKPAPTGGAGVVQEGRSDFSDWNP